MLLFAGAAPADELLVPAADQAAILKKIWTLDRTFPTTRTVTVAVLYQKKYRRSQLVADGLAQALRIGTPLVRVVMVDLELVPAAEFLPKDTDVAFIVPLRAVDVNSIAREARSRRVRTVTCVAEYVNDGVSVGIAVEKERPRILINLEAARAEGSEYSSQLLALARIVRTTGGPRVQAAN